MQARLGFSVVAHVDAEILLIDEVLAVGDAEFQQRCVDRMRELSTKGTTIVFVSHEMKALKSFCTHVFTLDTGRLA
jgi:ABC-type polysaccharide/polyol phosphate transport system ATPase subunit